MRGSDAVGMVGGGGAVAVEILATVEVVTVDGSGGVAAAEIFAAAEVVTVDGD